MLFVMMSHKRVCWIISKPLKSVTMYIEMFYPVISLTSEAWAHTLRWPEELWKCIVVWLQSAFFFCHRTVGTARNTTCAQLPAPPPLLSPGELIGLEHRAEGQHSRMTETAHSKLGKKSRWTSLEIGLITIVSLFFIIIVALIVLFTVHQKCEL